MTTAIYIVKGMTCGHCKAAVSSELTKLDGVTEVDVDVTSGEVTVTSSAPLATEAVRTAVEEAGYEMAN